MARETKVGLLAGLAFIICFAIILTNRGREEATAPPRPILSDSGGRVPASLQQSATRSAARTAPLPPRSGSELALADRLGSGGGVPAADPTPLQPATLSAANPGPVGLGEAAGGNAVPRTGDPSTLPLLPQTSFVPVHGMGSSPNTNSTAKATGTAYTVASGDTLSKIALAHYGNKSKALVEAIFEANRTVLQSPDNLKTGFVLTLPDLPASKHSVERAPVGAQSSAKSAATEPKASPTIAAKDSSDTSYRFYQVKKNDRWVSIARDQLGDAGRWKELHELNKQKFPDPQKIREGVRIKLPGAKALATLEGRR